MVGSLCKNGLDLAVALKKQGENGFATKMAIVEDELVKTVNVVFNSIWPPAFAFAAAQKTNNLLPHAVRHLSSGLFKAIVQHLQHRQICTEAVRFLPFMHVLTSIQLQVAVFYKSKEMLDLVWTQHTIFLPTRINPFVRMIKKIKKPTVAPVSTSFTPSFTVSDATTFTPTVAVTEGSDQPSTVCICEECAVTDD